MIFRICEEDEQILYQREVVCLKSKISQSELFDAPFTATYYDDCGRIFPLGHVRIGMQGIENEDIRNHLALEFITLPEPFFSLGMDEDYYENIKNLGDSIREALLNQLRDIPYLSQWPDNAPEAPEAMLRCIDPNINRAIEKVRGQFRRMAQGKDRLTEYHFSYTSPQPGNPVIPPVSLQFDVTPDSKPPTNIHALIGRNGCGKTYLIKHMVQSLQEKDGSHGQFVFTDRENKPVPMSFANVVCIAFSPFDNFAELLSGHASLPSTFIGLDKEKGNLLQVIQEDFLAHFRNCLVTAKKRNLWRRAIETLKSDLTFKQEQIDLFMGDSAEDGSLTLSPEREAMIIQKFNQLSSGHKVVLLMVTGCVAEVEERTIVFLDEPENHLHPPLLSALIRTLSDLLMDRNGVAIVSTHSPVVLQEVPSSCVYVLNRYGDQYVKPDRPEQETFGTSVGSLIDDAFSFEVANSGFHKMIVDAAAQSNSYGQILEEFGGHLGDEARILLRMLIRLNQSGV